MDWSSQKEKGALPQAVKIELRIAVEDRNEKDVERAYSTIVTFPR